MEQRIAEVVPLIVPALLILALVLLVQIQIVGHHVLGQKIVKEVAQKKLQKYAKSKAALVTHIVHELEKQIV